MFSAFSRLALALVCALVSASISANGTETYTLGGGNDQNGTLRVELKFEAAGSLTVLEGGKLAAPLRFQLSSEQHFAERRLPADDDSPLAVRAYDKATATIQVGENRREPSLADNHRTIVVYDGPDRPFACPVEPLGSDEAELLAVPCAAVDIDRLLPTEPVALKQSWTHSDDLAAALLGVDAVSASSLKSQLVEVRGDLARVELTGVVHGAEQGVAAEINVKARYTANLKERRVRWIGMVLKEKRAAGAAAPGIEATSRLTMTVAPGDSESLSDASVADACQRASASQPLAYRKPGAFLFTYDRDWHEIAEHEQTVVLRRVDRGEVIGQCNLTWVDPKTHREATNLPAFEAEVRRVLGENLERIVSSDEIPHPAGYEVFRVVAAGKAEDLPIRWIYYRLRDDAGRQAACVFTVEQQYLDRFASADQRLLSAFRFAPAGEVAKRAERQPDKPSKPGVSSP